MRPKLSYANVVATLALCAAVGGTAVAAGYRITSAGQIAPRVRKALHGKRGARGPTGVAGAAGVPGAKGDPGASGQTGPPGTGTPLLGSGQTIQGLTGFDETVPNGGQLIAGNITFPMRLAAAPTVAYVDIAGAPTANCPGSAADPQAGPGYACVYLSYRGNVQTDSSYASGHGIDLENIAGVDDAADKFGALVFGRSVAAGRAEIDATYAVTAP